MQFFESTEAQRDAGHALTSLLVQHKEVPLLLMLSGGSALSILEHIDTSTIDSRVTITTLDERFSTDPHVSNFLQIKNTSFFKDCEARGAKSIDTSVQHDETLKSAAARTEHYLRHWREINPAGVLIATVGIGTDGHTAGLFATTETEHLPPTQWILGYSLPNIITPYTERLTVTYTFLKTQVDHTVVYVTGEEKKKLLYALKERTLPRYIPMSILSDMKNVSIYFK